MILQSICLKSEGNSFMSVLIVPAMPTFIEAAKGPLPA